VADIGQVAATESDELSLPLTAAEPVVFDAEESRVTVELPSDGAQKSVSDLTTSYEGNTASDSIAVEAAGEGFRFLVSPTPSWPTLGGIRSGGRGGGGVTKSKSVIGGALRTCGPARSWRRLDWVLALGRQTY